MTVAHQTDQTVLLQQYREPDLPVMPAAPANLQPFRMVMETPQQPSEVPTPVPPIEVPPMVPPPQREAPIGDPPVSTPPSACG